MVNLLGLSFVCVSGLTSPWKFIVTKKRASIKSAIQIDPENDRRHSPRFTVDRGDQGEPSLTAPNS